MVVVGIEPLRQVQGGGGCAAHATASGHCKVAVQVVRLAERSKPRGHGTHHHHGIEHVVIEGEVVGGNEVHPGGHQGQPVAASNRSCDLVQLFGGDLPSPIPFKRPL